ncbi:uncharacterized protein F4812DRAFT_467808 [Daldinia caldariorum]|uniref:uncharacterized protein n=1 Tax=Daldinia caldariorum TaxID=326644 RepID=UPI0020082C03|nr:uncharacterized protein F4812DRAFT_467808 [Daldinia caldariorum]KAI1471930.1 hypothetical protein F4812DRAFT_467808 [Daldinia caldariorum]
MPRSGKSSSSGSQPSKKSESTHSETLRKAVLTGDNRVPYSERIRALRQPHAEASSSESRSDGNAGLVPPSLDPREPRPKSPVSPSVLSMLVNSGNTADIEKDLHDLQLALDGFTYNTENDDYLFDRLAHHEEEAAVNKRYSDSANERQRKRSSIPAVPSSRRVAVIFTPGAGEEQSNPFDYVFDNLRETSQKSSDKSSKKSDGDRKPRKDRRKRI